MKKSTWRKHHKVLGLGLCFFMFMFAMSGIVLNHRPFFSKVNVGRTLLPAYKFSKWNGGLLRGTLPLDSANVLIYGYAGMWLSRNGTVADFNEGLPSYADYRIVKNVVMMPDSSLFAATQYGLYHRPKNSGKWLPSSLSLGMERLSDVACLGDSLVVISRDRAFLALPPYSSFTQISLPAGSDYEGKVSLFRVVWLLHSGEMFGMAGKIVLDLLGVVMALLSVSGLLFWLFPKFIKRGFKKVWLISSTRFSFKSHNMVGIFTFVLLVFVVFTGWWLRPPLLIPLALNKMQGISGTAMSPNQPWQDKLRTIRYDNAAGDWILTTSDGFYSLSRSFEGVPQAMANAPHVSVMGVTVMQKDAQGRWLVGSLSGMWKWNRAEGKSVDYFTGEPMPEKAGAPFGKTPVAGFSSDFGAPIVAEYDDGTQSLPQPDSLRNLPMSLWQLALEIHTGRIYNLFGLAPLIWVFLAGFLALWLLISGWKIRQSLKK